MVAPVKCDELKFLYRHGETSTIAQSGSQRGFTALLQAVRSVQETLGLVDLLIEHGADLNAQDNVRAAHPSAQGFGIMYPDE